MEILGELLFLLTAYPWFLICFLLAVSLWFLHTAVGHELQFRLERYFALIILRDLDVHVRSDERWYEPSASQVAPFEVLDMYYTVYYDEAPKAGFRAALRVSLDTLRAAMGFNDSTQSRELVLNDLRIAADMLYPTRFSINDDTPLPSRKRSQDLSGHVRDAIGTSTKEQQDRGLSVSPRAGFNHDEFQRYDASKE